MQLIRDRINAGLNTDWGTFCAQARCGGCGTDDVRVGLRINVSDRALGKGGFREQLVFKALCVLEDALRATVAGRQAAGFGLRFALAYLYAVGDRRDEWFDREPYVEFWQTIIMPEPESDIAKASRLSTLQTNINGIGRAAGMEITPVVMGRLANAVTRVDVHGDVQDAPGDV